MASITLNLGRYVSLLFSVPDNLNNERWNHSGFSSKGKPIDEVWIQR